jgi:hypothetical protein
MLGLNTISKLSRQKEKMKSMIEQNRHKLSSEGVEIDIIFRCSKCGLQCPTITEVIQHRKERCIYNELEMAQKMPLQEADDTIKE